MTTGRINQVAGLTCDANVSFFVYQLLDNDDDDDTNTNTNNRSHNSNFICIKHT